MGKEIKKPKNVIFNSRIEIALRLLFVFCKSTRSLDLQRLIYYHYFLIHSSDANGPASIHPKLPFRSCEMLINRTVFKRALTLLVLKDLITVTYSKKEGISYKKNAKTDEFVRYLESDYSKQLQKCAEWLCSTFDNLTDGQVADLADNNLDKWGIEFTPIYDEVEG
jgi:hypothetical protein